LNERVLDASVVVKWFHEEGERHHEQARTLRAAFEAGRAAVFAPPMLCLEILNVAARRWGWKEPALVELACTLGEVGFDFVEPEFDLVARWSARGLTACDAAYVALAEQERIPLITDDALILSTAGGIAEALAAS
jgi:predicted nucleic acid-binding protein